MTVVKNRTSFLRRFKPEIIHLTELNAFAESSKLTAKVTWTYSKHQLWWLTL